MSQESSRPQGGKTVKRSLSSMKQIFDIGSCLSHHECTNIWAITGLPKASKAPHCRHFWMPQPTLLRNLKPGQLPASMQFYFTALTPTQMNVDKTFNEQISNLSQSLSRQQVVVAYAYYTHGRKDYTLLAGHLLDAKIREFFVYPIN